MTDTDPAERPGLAAEDRRASRVWLVSVSASVSVSGGGRESNPPTTQRAVHRF